MHLRIIDIAAQMNQPIQFDYYFVNRDGDQARCDLVQLFLYLVNFFIRHPIDPL
jgi:hypothetical protein